jgi:hypothetical protein
MDEINVDKELLDYEPTDATSSYLPDNPGNNASADGAQGAGSGRRHHGPSPAASNGPESTRRARRGLGKSFADIAAGHALGQYPAIESIIGRRRTIQQLPYERERESNGRFKPYSDESSAWPAGRRLIADIRPPVKERVAILEHELGDAEQAIGRLHTDMSRETHELELRLTEKITTITTRLDKDVVPAIDKVANRNTIKMVLTTLLLILSMAANIIALYRYFSIKI